MNTRFALLASVVATLAACSSVPVRNSALDQASLRYNSAKASSQISTLAPDELKRAGDSLRVAEQAWMNGDTTVNVDHLAYMTAQRVTIAQDSASARASQAVTAGAAAERDKMRLAMRTSEADTAQQKLAVSQQDNARKSTELTEAAAATDAAQQQLALSRQSNADKTAELAAADAAALREKARVSDLETQLKDLNAKKTDRGMVVTLGDVLFDSGQSRLSSDGSRNMFKLAEFFKRNPERKASVEGYTDNVGAVNANHDLSQRRATSVMTALVNMGVPADRLSTRAHGEDDPVANNDSAAGRQMNRRVEIVFAPQSEEISKK